MANLAVPGEGRQPGRLSVAFFAVFLLAAALRAVDVWRPADGSVRNLWRELDVAGIARNYAREDMNLLHPRIDWRGDGPGLVESEFPIYPWLVACLYRVFGEREELARVLMYAISLVSCGYVTALARWLLPPPGALLASFLFATHPLAIRLATCIQPETLMFVGYAGGAYHFLRWAEAGCRGHWLASLSLVILGSLVKIPAIHIGIFIACICLQRFGLGTFRRPGLWLYAALALVVPIAWYAHARQYWLEYGNSLGISNEAFQRISSVSFLRQLVTTIKGNFLIEGENVFLWAGIPLALLGTLRALGSPRTLPLAFWAGTLAIYYIVAGRTTSEGWAVHYHIVSLPAAVLAMAHGFLWRPAGAATAATPRWPGWVLLLVGGVAAAAGVNGVGNPSMKLVLYGGAALLVSAAVWLVRPGLPRRGLQAPDSGQASGRLSLPVLALELGLCLVLGAYLVLNLRQVAQDMRPSTHDALYRCAVQFRPLLQPGALIVATTGRNTDAFGIPQANNPPQMFYWTDSKGWNLPEEESTLERLEELRRRGARYLIAQRNNLEKKPGFEAELRRSHRTLAECGLAILFELVPGPR